MIIQAGVEMIRSYESLHDGDKRTPELEPMLCPTGWVTAGWGHVLVDPNTGRRLKGARGLARAKKLWPEGFTMDQAEAWFREDIAIAENGIDRLVSVPLNENQKAALVSFAYNVGVAAFSESTMLRLINEGDYDKAALEFHKWDKGTINGKKQVLKGLVARREAERMMFVKPVFEEPKEIGWTKTVKGGAGALIAGIGSLASQVYDTLRPVHDKLLGLGMPVKALGIVLATAAVCSAGFVIYARVRDRRKGRR